MTRFSGLNFEPYPWVGSCIVPAVDDGALYDVNGPDARRKPGQWGHIFIVHFRMDRQTTAAMMGGASSVGSRPLAKHLSSNSASDFPPTQEFGHAFLRDTDLLARFSDGGGKARELACIMIRILGSPIKHPG
jgi:hypothetical protein